MRIFFVCPDDPVPRGGIYIIYKHALFLREMGFQAYILHAKPHFQCSWFDLPTPPIVYPKLSFLKKTASKLEECKQILKQTLFRRDSYFTTSLRQGQKLFDKQGNTLPKINEKDLLVFPEFQASFYHSHFPDIPFVIFNQRAYATFENKPLPKKTFALKHSLFKNNPYHSKKLKGIIVVSKDNQDYVSYAFPNLLVDRVHLGVNASYFFNENPKQNKIVFMPRKGLDDAQQVLYLLAERGNLKDWEITPLEGMTLEEVASHVRSAKIFLSFSTMEGFPLPPLEAMASGATVIGYHGQGAKESFLNDLTFPIPKEDIISFAKTVEKAALHYDPSIGERASAFIQTHYNEAIEKEDVRRIWTNLIKR